MARHPKGQGRIHCTLLNANLAGTCPHYIPRHYGRQCRGFEQAITEIKTAEHTIVIGHCKHDPPRAEQIPLPL